MSAMIFESGDDVTSVGLRRARLVGAIAVCLGVHLPGMAQNNLARAIGGAVPPAGPSVTAPAVPANRPAIPAVRPVVPLAPKESLPVRVLLSPEKETTISSAIAARIVAFNGTLGQSFKAGDVLVSFDCGEASARLAMSRAELSGAIDQHEAKVKMQGLDQASAVEVSLAASAVNKARAQVALNSSQVSQCRIYAPWPGRVAKVNVKNHMTVTPGQPLMELVNSGPLKIKLNVPSKLLAKIRTGSEFKVVIDETGRTYDAYVALINSRIDAVSQTVELEARMSTDYKELLPGMSGVADLGAYLP